MGSDVIATKLLNEPLFPLDQLRKHPDIPIKRTRPIFNRWAKSGARAGNGEVVTLEAISIDGVLHSSIGAVRRLIAELAKRSHTSDGRVIVNTRYRKRK